MKTANRENNLTKGQMSTRIIGVINGKMYGYLC